MSTDQVVSDGARELFVGRLVPQETLVALADYTPFYIYDLATVQRRYRKLTMALPPQVRVYYAIKANPSLRLVQELTALGAGMEIASAGELAVAERLGISGDRVLFTGPAKTDDELAASVRYGLRTINVESLGEARRLDSIVAAEAQHADSLHRRQPILLRVNARFEVHDTDAAVQLGGGAQKFGVDEEQLDDMLPQILKLQTPRSARAFTSSPPPECWNRRCSWSTRTTSSISCSGWSETTGGAFRSWTSAAVSA